MALICRKCYADVTDDVAAAPPKKPFKCKCGCAVFIQQTDDPVVAYKLTTNDKKLLRRFNIKQE